MKRISLSIALPTAVLIMLGTASATHAASTANLKVTGVIRPGACDLTLSSRGTVDYGTIARTNLSANAPTALPEKIVVFVINCPGSAAKTALKLTDNRADTVVNGIIQAIDNSLGDKTAFGLGTANNKHLGVYGVQFHAVNGENGLLTPYHRDDSSSGWLRNAQIADHYFSGDQKSWGISDVSGPSAFKRITGYLNIRAVIDKLGNLPAGDDLQLNGSATLEVIYL